mmetsp:Transcript_65344/g.115954  ORF Transcript_65344/g.115954 Transcript_65344/m.115954 type:complete len:287 (+) Transcript_65344:55-915(+)|eukprot:CAMPEP_0197664610 /NCGR_PEP_ID=MMETSP1338-20131121/58743_1 /TAXON_ID=43686 ORGANISM="Pelagodinium beii, Strain RCC1491" /NCGR_SAMPLE_ID=MMETSP1338 /ASSEMBLY_ACC=CAM_ASM_000754 /LENGTH=286 /DNA_ID=CAMNT_0043243291 /DNA_START=55 /DNA_END=915 /DNA_ORIENTATION=+
MQRAATAPALHKGDDWEGMEPDSPLSAGTSRTMNMSRTFQVSDRLMQPTRSRDLGDSQLLKVTDAYKYSIDRPPQYTMRPKGKGSFFGKPSVETEFGPDISKQVDKVKTALPHWSLQPRPKKSALDVDGSWVPAPGTYPIKTTVEKTHPTLPTTGRGWHWGSTVRSPPMQMSDAPDPGEYKVKDDYAKAKDPTWSIGKKLEYDPDKEKRGVYNIQGYKRKGGKVEGPLWSFTKRPESGFVSKETAEKPGPGAHTLPKDTGGRMKRTPSFAFSRASRWGKAEEMRPY